METTQKTPTIVRRDVRFDFGARDMGAWHPEGRHVTHFFNALSTFFPEGEVFFIDSVLHYRDQIAAPKLAVDVKGFTGQEGMHSREHRRYNRALAASGLPVQRLEERLKGFLDFLRRRLTPEEMLAVTIALEHYTAIMANTPLSDPRVLEGADPALAAIWRWHAIEETEHKAVAYDVYSAVMGTGMRAYLTRVYTMIGATLIFWSLVFRYHFALVRADGVATCAAGGASSASSGAPRAFCARSCVRGCRTSGPTFTPGSTTTPCWSSAGRRRTRPTDSRPHKRRPVHSCSRE
jgi:uncharacterized protein